MSLTIRTVREIFVVEISGPDGDNWALQDAYNDRALAQDRASRYEEYWQQVGAHGIRSRVRTFVPEGELVCTRGDDRATRVYKKRPRECYVRWSHTRRQWYIAVTKGPRWYFVTQAAAIRFAHSWAETRRVVWGIESRVEVRAKDGRLKSVTEFLLEGK